ncbi:sok1p [Saccharomyces arboricola H-6]|uniref:Sok1p n=1 Tax=Saccharomyces arboricola (strain H-6 / AS 2.3317 / CBS 10644) TaxID=1160507 RepID=J8PQ86_SACAR|nr:sok1p [Saccharomyces arboricola H-6]
MDQPRTHSGPTTASNPAPSSSNSSSTPTAAKSKQERSSSSLSKPSPVVPSKDSPDGNAITKTQAAALKNDMKACDSNTLNGPSQNMIPNRASMQKYIDQSTDLLSRSSGVITPSMSLNTSTAATNNGSCGNSTSNSSSKIAIDKDNTIFKTFDTKTGQFLKNANEEEMRRNNKVDSIPPKDIHANINNPSPSPPPSSQQPPSASAPQLPAAMQQQQPQPAAKQHSRGDASNFLRIFSNNKMRSHSVPTILHSSLRKLSSHNQYYRNQNILLNHQTSSGISKKKFSRNHHQPYLHSNNTLSTNPLSIKRAIFLNQQISNNTNTNNDNINDSATNSMANPNFLSSSNFDLTLEDRITYIKATPIPAPFPPINLQGLKEIDLQEILKNPQLRHDIIFDPLLQFRPNLDGERGNKKRQLANIYWNDVQNEIYVYSKKPEIFQYSRSRLVPLFDTLRDVLLTIVPQKESPMINNVLDTELNIQELLKGSLIMSNLSGWLADLFKHHCAPMRDPWVDKMSNKFKEAERDSSLTRLIEGLRLVFQILETMKLDIANHQIRILRPALLSNAVEFEKQYFNTLIASKRVNLNTSLLWFDKRFNDNVSMGLVSNPNSITILDVYNICIRSIISLLSCRKMVRDYPTPLSFDHARLILLRADIRQIVCILVSRLLFQQLVANDSSMDKVTKEYVIHTYTTKRLKNEIVSIITDEHGNCRWTKNTMSIAVHLCKVIDDLHKEYDNKNNNKNNNNVDHENSIRPQLPSLDNAKITFAKSWLSKQTQPLSEVYGVLENRVFKSLEDTIFNRSECTIDGRVKQDFVYLYNTSNGSVNGTNTSTTTTDAASVKISPSLMSPSKTSAATPTSNTTASRGLFAATELEEFDNVYRHLYALINLHWSVFGPHYVEMLGDRVNKKGI